ncbi:MAG: Fe(3+) ABC transporter substrate-binding protein [Synechococcales cyanobacterium CRU_2_2]|nr:Fe(3+) ABC transporter substrate-binding protein [Synechococcales cyanobacterium CRU_2_2]
MTCVSRIFGSVAQNLTTAMLFLALLTGCGDAPQAGGGSGPEGGSEGGPEGGPEGGAGVVNVYSARHYNTDNQLYADFTAQSGVKVNVIEGKDSELLERIKSEGDRSPADIFLTVDAGRLWRAEKDGLFKPVQSKRLEAEIPANLRHPEGLWFGLSKRARIFVYNPEQVQVQELSTYEDLASPKWKGRICVRSSNSIYNQSLVAWMIEKNGAEKTEAWAKALVDNFARQPEGGDVPQIQAVAEGSCALAIVNHYYFARLLKSKDPKDQAISSKVSAYFPQPTHVNIGGAGVLVKAPHPENSVKFLEFLASPTGQAFFAEGNTEYPVVKGIPLDPVLEKFGKFDASPVNVSAYGQNNAQAIEIMNRVGWK